MRWTSRWEMASPRPVPPNRRLIELSPWLKTWNKPVLSGLVHANAGVPYAKFQLEHQRIGPRDGHLEIDLPLRRKLDRVAGEVEEHLLQPHGIADHQAG